MVNLALMIINEVVIAKSLIIHIIFRLIFFSPVLYSILLLKAHNLYTI